MSKVGETVYQRVDSDAVAIVKLTDKLSGLYAKCI